MIVDRAKIDARHPELHEHMEAWLHRRGCSWRQLAVNDVPGLAPPPGMQCDGQVEALQLLILLTDPVLFAETQFIEKPASQRDSDRWRLFDFQKPSLRRRGNFVYSCGAGVGKTRTLITLLLWGIVARQGLTLIVGNQESTVYEILEEVEFIRDRNPYLEDLLPKQHIKLKPHPRIKARNGNAVLMVPTGPRGHTLRSKHVHNFLLGDECAVWHEIKIWEHFWSRREPGCETRLFSVPDGRTDTEFYRIKEGAVDFETAGDMPAQWYRIRWQKTDMPEPFWSEAVKRQCIADYGGEETPGYLQNVYGLDGDPEAAVFPKAGLDACLSATTPYTLVSVAIAPDQDEVRARVFANHPGYFPGSDEPALLELDDNTFACDAASDDQVDEDPWAQEPAFNLTAYLAGHVHLRPGDKVIGADYGYQTDPSEFLIFDLDDAGVLTLEVRIHLRRVAVDDQEIIVRWLLETFEPQHGMGGDGFGIGQAIDQRLPRPLRRRYSPINFQQREDLLDERSRPLLDDDKKPRKATVKAIAVQGLERRVQRRSLRLPHDQSVIRQFANYVARKTKNGRSFNPRHAPDHIVDAAQAAEMRLYRLLRGQTTPPPLSSITTVPRRSPLAAGDLRGLESFAGWEPRTSTTPRGRAAKDVPGVTVLPRRRLAGGDLL